MTTAAMPGIDELQQEALALEGELSALNAKLTAEQRTLGALTDERAALSETVALGKEKPAKVSELAGKIEQSEAAVAGFEALVGRKQKRYDEVVIELRRQRAETLRASEMAEIEKLKAEGAAIVARIVETLSATASGDLAKYQEVRKRLGQLVDRVAVGVFPIPPTALAARDAQWALDQTIAEKLAPILKLWRA